jgi:transposase
MSSVSGAPRRDVLGPRAELVAVRVLHKRLGSLPVVADFCRRLDVAGVIDRACPMREVARITHGQVIEALIANRLTSPTPMVRVSQWAREWAVPEVFQIAAGSLGDDRLARALDAIAPELDHIVGSVGATAISEFGIDVAHLHWDMTSISLFGAYEQVDEDYPAPAWGHPKDRRVDLKQIQTGLAVTGDGGIPVWHRAYDGGAGEVAQVVTAMTELKHLAGPRDLLLVGDSKLVSYGNVRAFGRANVTFIAPLGAARVPEGLFASLNLADTTTVDYIAQRDAGKPADQRCVYRVAEDTMVLSGPRRRDPPQHLRRILVHSTANQSAAANARALKLGKARAELDKLTRTAGSRYYPDRAAVTRKITEIAGKRRVTAYLHTQITTDPDTGRPALTWDFDQTAIDADAATDGWYALLTNLPDTVDAAEVLRRYKGQAIVERRYSDFKGPLAVAPLFLKHNRRIAALITVICLALLIFCLVEREVRRNLAPDTGLVGFYAYDNRAIRPTGRSIFTALALLQLIPARRGKPPKIPAPTDLQARLLTLLHVDPTRPRWPQ